MFGLQGLCLILKAFKITADLTSGFSHSQPHRWQKPWIKYTLRTPMTLHSLYSKFSPYSSHFFQAIFYWPVIVLQNFTGQCTSGLTLVPAHDRPWKGQGALLMVKYSLCTPTGLPLSVISLVQGSSFVIWIVNLVPGHLHLSFVSRPFFFKVVSSKGPQTICRCSVNTCGMNEYKTLVSCN